MTRKKFKIPMKGDATKDVKIIETGDVCDVCGGVLGDHWVVLGNRKTIHYGGEHDLNCYRKAQP